MSYTAWSVIFGETPSTAKWNQLGENDAGFRDGTNFLDDIVKSKHIDWADTGSGDEGGIWWEEVGRTTLSGAGDTITISSIAARKYLRLLISVIDTGGTISGRIIFNNDTAANYANRFSTNGGADTTEVSNSSGIPFKTTVAEPSTADIIVTNITAQEKLVTGNSTSRGVAGAAAAPNKMDISGKWINTSVQISRVDILNTGSGDFAIGSELIVLGHN